MKSMKSFCICINIICKNVYIKMYKYNISRKEHDFSVKWKKKKKKKKERSKT